MEDDEVMRAMTRDDAYRVVRVLADGPAGKTELVTYDGSDLLVRKRMPARLANAGTWASLMGAVLPHLPRVESLYQMPDELVVVYAYVPGRSLRELVESGGRLAPKEAATIIADVCDAAGALHARGIVHRDITPGNVIVADEGAVADGGAYLVDLGIARVERQEALRDTSVLGTWGFAAPEQFGFAQTDQRSDIYAIGRLLGYALTGERPDAEAFACLLADEGTVDPALARVVDKATRFEPSARYQSTDALKEALCVALASGEGSRAADVPAEADGLAVRSSGQQGERHAAEPSAGGLAPGWRMSSAATPRRYDDAPLPARIATVTAWVLMGMYVALVAECVRTALTAGDPPWHAGEFAIAGVTCLFCAAVSRELYLALTLRGPYGWGRPVVRLASHLAVIALATFFVLFVLSLVFGVA